MENEAIAMFKCNSSPEISPAWILEQTTPHREISGLGTAWRAWVDGQRHAADLKEHEICGLT
jgi:hypothetical protein